MTDDPQIIKARREVAALKGLLIHALIYTCVISGLIGLNMLLPKSGWWAHWPTIGWGIGLFLHGTAVFTPPRLFDQDWEEREIQKRLGRK
jgi:hypothetical protein